MKRVGFLLIALFLVGSSQAESLDAGVMSAAKLAMQKGVKWLVTQQKEDGSWSEARMPALTALPLWAIVATGESGFDANITKAADFVVKSQQPDGGFYVPSPGRPGGGLGNYNTSICVASLFATGRKDLIPPVLKGRSYIASSQHIGDDWHSGGFGYDKAAQRRYSDLNNAHYSIDAMRRTQAAEEMRPAGEKRVDINWDAALKYIMQLQNTEGETAGGFAYNTQDPKGGSVTNESGKVMLRAYGSMTYAGLLSMIHAHLERSDPRVRSAVEYASRFWTVKENPGQGIQGVYFYYNVMSRALSAAGMDTLPGQNNAADVAWRKELAQQIIGVQKEDGFWVNENNRWWENDPVLATSYSILALAFTTGITK